MQIVIDIPVSLYEDIMYSAKNTPRDMDYCDRLIAKGTPLPKGHGRIGDFDAFLKGFLFDKRADNLECGWIRELIEQTTIIQADDAESEIDYAHWIDNNNGTISCSYCHTWFNKDDRYSYMHYCPYCNVKMREIKTESEDKHADSN